MARAAVKRVNSRNSEAVRLINARASGSGFVHGLNINLQRMEEEYVTALRNWPDRVKILQRMGNDAKIAAILRAYTLPIISAVRWKAEDGTDKGRELLAGNLLREGDPELWCETSWEQRLYEKLLCLQYGISLFGKTREITSQGYVIFRRITYLHPRSLGGTLGPWEFDDSGSRLVAIHRTYKMPDGSTEQDERIPIDDLFAVVWGMAGDQWEGQPLIRSMYRAWTEKDIAAKIQMIDLMNRGVGIPMFTLGPNDGAKDAESGAQIAKDARQGDKSRAFILKKHEQEFEFLTSGSTLDASPIIAEKNNEFAAGGGTDFQQQGQTTSGSRATGSVLMVNYMQELDATRQILQAQINHGAGYCKGLGEELQDDNLTPEEIRENGYAQIIGTRVSPSDQLDNASQIVDAIGKGSLIHDVEAENHVRKAWGIKALTSEEFQREKDALKPMPSIGGRPTEPDTIERDDPRDDTNGRRFGLTEKKTPNTGASLPTMKPASWSWMSSRAD